jgi:hypothetical protein
MFVLITICLSTQSDYPLAFSDDVGNNGNSGVTGSESKMRTANPLDGDFLCAFFHCRQFLYRRKVIRCAIVV